jgi:pimeloyl-ACP methyl ester carboxylesterase
MDRVQVDGLRIAYERKGAGPPLVLLHGGPTDHREWRHQIEGLSDEFTVVAWDAPGCGHSSDPPETFRAPEYAECLATFIHALDLGRPHVAGLSFGSVLALELYRRYPLVPRTLVLASAYAGWAGSLPPDAVEPRVQDWLRKAELPPDQFALEWLPGLISESARPELVDEVALMLSDFHPVGQRVMPRAFGAVDLSDVLPRIEVPTLLLYGDRDVRSPVSVGEDLQKKIPGSRLAVIAGAAHLCDIEAGEQFNAQVRAFLRSVDE